MILILSKLLIKPVFKTKKLPENGKLADISRFSDSFFFEIF